MAVFCLQVGCEGGSGVCEEGTRGEAGLGGTFLVEVGVSASAPGLSKWALTMPSGSKSSTNFLQFARLSLDLADMAVRSSFRRNAMRESFSSKL